MKTVTRKGIITDYSEHVGLVVFYPVRLVRIQEFFKGGPWVRVLKTAGPWEFSN